MYTKTLEIEIHCKYYKKHKNYFALDFLKEDKYGTKQII